MTSNQLIIFSDMDGSLLDHESYSHEDADECLDWLRSKQIPVIPCTSKTRAEMEVLRTSISNSHPFIVENGAAVCIPKEYFTHLDNSLAENGSYLIKHFTETRAYWQGVLENVPMHLNDAFLTFEQAGIEGIMQMTGLAINEARLASQREFGEPLKWLGNEQQFQQFEEYVISQHGKLLKGGRFVHLSGDCDKGHAMNWLIENYRQASPGINFISIALGDSQNDVAMLSVADYAIMIRSPVHDFPVMECKMEQQLYCTQQYGPKGWVEGIEYVLGQLN